MNLINCTCPCVYQEDGVCKLDHSAMAINSANHGKGCLHFVDKSAQKQNNDLRFTGSTEKIP